MVIDVTTTETALCDNNFPFVKPITSEFTPFGSFDHSNIVGFTMDNVIISSALDYANRDAVEQMSDYMDFCLSYADE